MLSRPEELVCVQTIVQYIADKHRSTGPSLEASTPEKRAIAHQATRFMDLYILSIFVSATGPSSRIHARKGSCCIHG